MTALVAEKSEYQILDDADSRQIEQAENAVKQALVYKTNNNTQQLTYMGIKWLVLKMSERGEALQIPELPKIELVKHDPEDKSQWIWYATIKVRNSATGLETIGASEQCYVDRNRGNQYDPFGRTKAISKAERNAFRKQIPELVITEMLSLVKSSDVEVVNVTPEKTTETPQQSPETTESDDPPTTKQINYLEILGYTGKYPKTKNEASALIKSIKEKAT